jgi:lysine 6-dehydrogenase
MKIVVFGGAGDVGSQAVADLAITPGVERVTIADRNRDAAQALADRIGSGAVDIAVTEVDAMDHGALVDAMLGHDVAASALGPFYVFESRLVRAAIAAGVDYTSVCDDYSAAEEVMRDFDASARESGRTIITGLGVSPGLTNAVVALFAERLDRVKRVDVSVYQPLSGGGAEAVVRHVLFIMTGKIAAWRGGRACRVAACSDERFVELPRVGRAQVWNMGHPEPVTVPRFIPGIEECNFYMGFGRGARPLVAAARRNIFANRWLTEATVRAVGLVERLTPASAELPEGAVRIEVWGEKNGADAYHMGCGVGEMRRATGLSLAVGTVMLGNRRLLTGEGGVYAPEACLRPAEFLGLLREKGLAAYSDLELTKPLL